MDARLKTQWLEALRSGKFRQAQGTLLDEDGAMCCLGVLAHIQGCDLSALPTDERATVSAPKGFDGGLDFFFRNELGRMNDHGSTFAELAAHIEATFPGDA